MNSHCANSNLSVASPPVSTRVCVVFGSEEKEKIPDGVQVIDGANHRGGGAAGQPFSTFMQRIYQRFADLEEMIAANGEMIAANGEKIAATGEMIAALDERVVALDERIAAHDARFTHMTRRLDESAELYNEQQYTSINKQQGTTSELRQRNQDLPIDQGLIDELSSYLNTL
jgi:hypothetical protein